MRNHEVTKEQPLLGEDGKIAEPGWARRPVWKYDRKAYSVTCFPDQGVGLLSGDE